MVLAFVEFSAQFGGTQSARELLPHLRALKRAAERVAIEGVPFEKLGVVLRANDALAQFGVGGVDRVRLDKRSEYLGVDIVVPEARWRTSGDAAIKAFFDEALRDAADRIQTLTDARMRGVDRAPIARALQEIRERYEAESLR